MKWPKRQVKLSRKRQAAIFLQKLAEQLSR